VQAILVTLLSVVGLIILHSLMQIGFRQLGRLIARPFGKILAFMLRPFLTRHYRRKVIKQMQARRKAEGAGFLRVHRNVG
jgi:hypothetical protein